MKIGLNTTRNKNMSNSNRLYSALRARYKAQIIEAEADALNFFENPVAVAEHPHMVDTMDILITKLSEAEDKLETLELNFGEHYG
jgi:FMN-dependent NADH-azoreductase